MRITSVTLKSGEKRGQPNYGSRSYEVTFTADVAEGESMTAALAMLRREARAALAFCFHEGPQDSEPVAQARPQAQGGRRA